MPSCALLARRTRRTASVQDGQILVLFALLIVAILGFGALAVDVGMAYHQRQQQQNMAVNASLAGSYEVFGYLVNGTPTATTPAAAAATADARVLQSMRDVLASAGMSVQAIPANGDACAAHFTANQVFLDAIYIDQYGTPVPTVTSSSIPRSVGSGAFDPTARGVKVLRLGGCAPAFLAPVLGRQTFSVVASAQNGLLQPIVGNSTGATDTPIPTVAGVIPALASLTVSPTDLPTYTTTPTPTNTATSTKTVTPTPISTRTAVPTTTPVPPTATPTVDTTTQYAVSLADVVVYGNIPGPMLYGPGSTGFAPGDLVTVFGNGGQWASDQYATQAQALSGTPGGISVHDASMEGCYNQTQGAYSIGSLLDFNHGGVGHCTLPTSTGFITIPVVNEIYKNGGQCPNNGGYCEQVIAFVTVNVTSITNQVITGYIVSVVADPYGVVQVAPPTTPTPTVTPVPAMTLTPTVSPTRTSTGTPTTTNTPSPTPSPTIEIFP